MLNTAPSIAYSEKSIDPARMISWAIIIMPMLMSEKAFITCQIVGLVVVLFILWSLSVGFHVFL